MSVDVGKVNAMFVDCIYLSCKCILYSARLKEIQIYIRENLPAKYTSDFEYIMFSRLQLKEPS